MKARQHVAEAEEAQKKMIEIHENVRLWSLLGVCEREDEAVLQVLDHCKLNIPYCFFKWKKIAKSKAYAEKQKKTWIWFGWWLGRCCLAHSGPTIVLSLPQLLSGWGVSCWGSVSHSLWKPLHFHAMRMGTLWLVKSINQPISKVLMGCIQLYTF